MNLFGFFGIGPMELLVLGVLAVGGVIVVVVLVVGMNRKPSRPPRSYVDDLERENDDLHDENDRLRRGPR